MRGKTLEGNILKTRLSCHTLSKGHATARSISGDGSILVHLKTGMCGEKNIVSGNQIE